MPNAYRYWKNFLSCGKYFASLEKESIISSSICVKKEVGIVID